MGVYYLGQFPPPHGGVTVKNALLFRALSSRIPIEKLGFRDASTIKIVSMLLSSRTDRFLLGFGNEKLQRSLVCLLARIKPSVLRRCGLVAMGGMLPDRLSEDKRYRAACSKLRRIYLETSGMAERVAKLGLDNASVYPNCRERPQKPHLPKETKGPLKCVSFSLISPDKGADTTLDAAALLEGIEFHFYGQIEPGFRGPFESRVASLPNAFYHGVYDSVNDDSVAELAKYDLHLFPTHWPAEGVPGVLVETKVAAVPSIVSDISYNAELVRDGKEGIVLRENTAMALVEAISSLDANRGRLDDMKAEALKSAEHFYIDRYIDRLAADLADEPREVIA